MSDSTILTERLRGRTLRDLAEANDMTPEGVRLVVVRESRKHIDGLELSQPDAFGERTLQAHFVLRRVIPTLGWLPAGEPIGFDDPLAILAGIERDVLPPLPKGGDGPSSTVGCRHPRCRSAAAAAADRARARTTPQAQAGACAEADR